ncbi:TRSP domain-containing protein, partial [Bacillus altitudinis]|uniref:TRSP domain-containing protein n=1 Tax=Bacillus altitudinis TaxID=293387 RepID=UPI003B52AB76
MHQPPTHPPLNLQPQPKPKHTLSLPTPQFIYLPITLPPHIAERVLFHSTTTTPIHPVQNQGYPLQNPFPFFTPQHAPIHHYVYNIPKHHYHHLFFFFHKNLSQQPFIPLIHLFPHPHLNHL